MGGIGYLLNSKGPCPGNGLPRKTLANTLPISPLACLGPILSELNQLSRKPEMGLSSLKRVFSIIFKALTNDVRFQCPDQSIGDCMHSNIPIISLSIASDRSSSAILADVHAEVCPEAGLNWGFPQFGYLDFTYLCFALEEGGSKFLWNSAAITANFVLSGIKWIASRWVGGSHWL